MQVDDLNYASDLSAFMRSKKKLKPHTMLKRKCLYIEGIIRFLNLYCTNELGSGEVDITKVCLWVNSPWFENNMTWSIRNLDDVYRYLENDILAGVPLYRLLRISDHLRFILERDHIETLQESLLKDAEKTPCLKCIWYDSSVTQLGSTSACKRPSTGLSDVRNPGYFHIDKVRACKFCTTAYDDLPSSITDILKKTELHHRKLEIEESITKRRDKWLKKFSRLDNSVIPIEFETMDLEELRRKIYDNPALDLGRVFNNKQAYSDIYRNLQEGMIVEAMIEFIEVYAKSEIGTDFIADISKVSEWVYSKREGNEKLNFISKEEIYRYLEDLVVNGFDILEFCKRSEDI